MTNEIESIESLQRKEWRLIEQLEDLQREERKIAENLDYYNYAQQKENRLLEEISFYSQGTTAEASAMREYDEQLQVEFNRKQTFFELEESLQRQKRGLKEAIQEAESQRRLLEQQEDNDDKD